MGTAQKKTPTICKADAGASCKVRGGIHNHYKDTHNTSLLQIPSVEANKWQDLPREERLRRGFEWRKVEQLRRLEAGERITAQGINVQIGFNDARKFMSDLRKRLLRNHSPFVVCTYTLPDNRVVYYLNTQTPQQHPNTEINTTSTAKEGGHNE
jgi:hypothetical protein